MKSSTEDDLDDREKEAITRLFMAAMLPYREELKYRAEQIELHFGPIIKRG